MIAWLASGGRIPPTRDQSRAIWVSRQVKRRAVRRVSSVEELLTQFNLHTVVRLPNGVFAPYTSIPTNLLFFGRSGPTRDIWFYEQPMPEGRKNYTKTAPIQYEVFSLLFAWWKDRAEDPQAWRMKASFPTLVAFDHLFMLTLRTGRELKPDFRLSVRMPHQTDVRLIECQSRNATDHALADKITTIRKDSDYKRFIFVYENRPSGAVMKEFEQQGVVVYNLDEFQAFVVELKRTMQAVRPVILGLECADQTAGAQQPVVAPLPPPYHREERAIPRGIVTTRVISPRSGGSDSFRGGTGGNFRTK
ncbi:MAG: N-6 DNA methylase [Phycisphaerales bacterium]|nr:N-6 DNA methylase [Phycisphaerales bacterium]